MTFFSRLALNEALPDIWRGARRFELYTLLAWTDVKNRYRRTRLGPFWLTISMGLFIVAVGLLYSVIFANRGSDYIPYFGTGVIVWAFINSTISEQSDVFISGAPIIQNINVPRSIFIFRVLVSTLIVLGHNTVIIIILAVIFRMPINATIISALMGVALIGLNGVFVGMSIGTVCARYRDLPHMIASFLQITFFLTPIIWQTSIVEHSNKWVFLILLNPFYHFVEIVRSPIVSGEVAPTTSWVVVILFTMIFGVLATSIYAARVRRLGLWL